MTGLEVADVNIRIAGVDMEKLKRKINSFLFLYKSPGGGYWFRRKHAKKRAERTYF